MISSLWRDKVLRCIEVELLLRSLENGFGKGSMILFSREGEFGRSPSSWEIFISIEGARMDDTGKEKRIKSSRSKKLHGCVIEEVRACEPSFEERAILRNLLNYNGGNLRVRGGQHNPSELVQKFPCRSRGRV